jgi:hypothetical protein
MSAAPSSPPTPSISVSGTALTPQPFFQTPTCPKRCRRRRRRRRRFCRPGLPSHAGPGCPRLCRDINHTVLGRKFHTSSCLLYPYICLLPASISPISCPPLPRFPKPNLRPVPGLATSLRSAPPSPRPIAMLHAVEQPLPAPLRYASLPSPPPEPSAAAVSPSSSSHLTSANPTAMAIPPRHHILIVTGPAGCGKSTVAKLLADRYAFNYIEGDEVRSQRCSLTIKSLHY